MGLLHAECIPKVILPVSHLLSHLALDSLCKLRSRSQRRRQGSLALEGQALPPLALLHLSVEEEKNDDNNNNAFAVSALSCY